MFVKFCGFTRPEDIEAAASLGISAAGFIFYKKSPRCVSREKARVLCRMLRGKGMMRVGVFVGASIFEIVEICSTTDLDALQLYDSLLAEELRGMRPIIAAYRVGIEADLGRIKTPSGDDMILLDSAGARGYGGTGERFDWSLLGKIPHAGRTIIAGGIQAQNLPELLSKIQPFGIDISSGIEDSPGIKSAEKMRDIMEMVRSIDKVKTLQSKK